LNQHSPDSVDITRVLILLSILIHYRTSLASAWHRIYHASQVQPKKKTNQSQRTSHFTSCSGATVASMLTWDRPWFIRQPNWHKAPT